MMQLRQQSEKLKTLDIQVLVIGPEKANAFRDYWTKHSIPFIGISDPQHRILKLYGQQVNLFKLGRMPAQMFIDKTGILRFVHYGHSMSDIPDLSEIEQAIHG